MIFRYLSYKCEQPQKHAVPISLRADPRILITCPSHVELEAGGKREATNLSRSIVAT